MARAWISLALVLTLVVGATCPAAAGETSSKTKVIERVVASLPNGAATGFFTREMRDRGTRRGFMMQTLDGRTAVLADVGGEGPQIGRYRVRIRELETVGVPALALRRGVRLVVVDEIGKMECLSERFCN